MPQASPGALVVAFPALADALGDLLHRLDPPARVGIPAATSVAPRSLQPGHGHLAGPQGPPWNS